MPWNPITDWQDWVDLGGHITPGLCEVVGADSPRQWDERQGYGLSGAIVVFHGRKLTHFSLKIRLYSLEDWADWYAFKPFVEPLPVSRLGGAMDITHPITRAVGIRSVVVENIIAPMQTADGEWTIEIKLIEFRRPKQTLAKPDGAKAAPAQSEADRRADAELANDQAQLESLSRPQP